MYKRPVSKYRKKLFKALALTRKILVSLVDNDGPDVRYYNYGLRQWTREDREYAKAAQMKRAMYDLRARKYIEIRKSGDRVMYVLTEKGRMAALKEQIRLADRRRDGKVLMLSFDIPEQEKLVRDKFRYALKDFGFKRIQHSLWGTKRDVAPQLIRLVKDTGAQKWIRIFLSSEVTHKKFKICDH